MPLTCENLFSGIDCSIIGNGKVEVSGIAYRSDQVQPGDAFFCVVGLVTDGHSFAQDALDRGAKVLVVERKVYLADATDVTEVVVKDSRKALALCSANFFDNPSCSFDLVGITGTNGKTTTTYLVENVARYARKKTGVIGTVGVRIGDVLEGVSRTTPESFDLQEIFSRMAAAQCEVVAMEVSSHALDLERTWGTKFAVSAFTNLTQDHLDYHKTFEAYFEAKARFFSADYPAKRVISIDDAWGKELLRRCTEAGDNVVSTGFDKSATIHPVEVEYGPASTTVTLEVAGESFTLTYPLVGKFNVENLMCAFGICKQLGIEDALIVEALKQVPPVPGRLQRVSAADGGFSVYVDYAHTPDALEKAIASVKEVTSGNTLVVFGCGGNRDTSKRSIMGRAALNADFAIVTSDNPRNEDPQAIINDILPGMKGAPDRFEVEADRRSAIARSIALAKPGDSVIIAGKGHENYQIVGDKTLSFDDVVVATEELNRVFG